MFKCACCSPAKEYAYKKGLHKHQRKYDPHYVSPLSQADMDRRQEFEKENRRCFECDTSISFEDRATKFKFCSQTCAAVHNNRARANFVCECCDPPRRFKTQQALSGHKGATASKPYWNNLSRANIKTYDDAPKRCAVCNQPIAYKDRRQTYCSQICNGESKAKYPRGVSSCVSCGIHIDKSKQRNWKYCTSQCMQDGTYRAYIEKWKNGAVSGGKAQGVSGHVRKYLFEKYDHKCCLCGWAKINQTTGKIPLQVDHINGNPNDHSEGNLQLICPNCHSLTSTYGVLNKGNGRAYRRQRYADGKS